jgi:hypothetical protein
MPIDLTPLDFFFWGFVKNTAYFEKVRNVNELCDRIISAAECIINETLASNWWDSE